MIFKQISEFSSINHVLCLMIMMFQHCTEQLCGLVTSVLSGSSQGPGTETSAILIIPQEKTGKGQNEAKISDKRHITAKPGQIEAKSSDSTSALVELNAVLQGLLQERGGGGS